MIVAYRLPHNEGVEAGIITGPGFDSDAHADGLIDLYEVDATIRSFDTEGEAHAWIQGFLSNDTNVEVENVLGGVLFHVKDY